jgi:hypothetical protein
LFSGRELASGIYFYNIEAAALDGKDFQRYKENDSDEVISYKRIRCDKSITPDFFILGEEINSSYKQK